MNEYTVTILYIVLGLIGASWHWAKKRFIEKKITLNFVQYVFSDLGATLNAVSAIICAELVLSATAGVHWPHLNEFLGAITTGYAADSHLNNVKQDETETNTI